MAKLRDTAINGQDLSSYVQTSSDFAFEMQVLSRLQTLGFECRHAGTYLDPVRERARQFDIRAVQNRGDNRLSIAVECKNLRSTFPLLISCVPRQQTETFHQRILFIREQLTAALQVRDSHKFYTANDMVAKQTDQVGKGKDGDWIANDQETFDKVSQAAPLKGCSETSEFETVGAVYDRALFLESTKYGHRPRLPCEPMLFDHFWNSLSMGFIGIGVVIE